MKREGEKTPPDPPEPNVRTGGDEFETEQQEEKPGISEDVLQDIHDRGISDPLHIIISGEAHYEPDHHSDSEHSRQMACVGVAGYGVEAVFGPIYAANEEGRNQSHDNPEGDEK